MEGLLGITVDNEEILLVNINETIQKEGFKSVETPEKTPISHSEDSSSGEEDSQVNSHISSKRRKRKRKRSKSQDVKEEISNKHIEMSVRAEACTSDDNFESNDIQMNIEDDESKDRVYVKNEPLDDDSYGQQSQDHDFSSSYIYQAIQGENNQPQTLYQRDESGDFPQIFKDSSHTAGMASLQQLALQLSSDSTPIGAQHTAMPINVSIRSAVVV